VAKGRGGGIQGGVAKGRGGGIQGGVAKGRGGLVFRRGALQNNLRIPI
jgi:hypothetical protein